MVKIAGIVILVLLAFVAGILYEQIDQSETDKLTRQIASLEKELAAQQQINENLNDTLKLVKRQIQTDRIAYQELQKIIDGSVGERAELRKQIESQQQLLKSMRDRLETSEN